MRFFVDTEFNGFGGDILSMAIVSERGKTLYLALPEQDIETMNLDPWVERYVVPVIDVYNASAKRLPKDAWGFEIQRFLRGAKNITFVADWPEDISHLMNAMIIAPGGMINLPSFHVDMQRVDAYAAKPLGAVRHNALWDARALCQFHTGNFTDQDAKAETRKSA